jgi:hypothetical protein
MTMRSVLGRCCLALFLVMALNTGVFAQVTVPVGGTTNVGSGSMNLGCAALNVLGTFNLNSGQVSNTGDVTIAATGTLNGGQGTLSVSGNWSNSGTFIPGTGTVIFTDGCFLGPLQITGTTVFNNLTLTSSNGRTFVIPAGANITVNGTLTLQGTSGQPISLVSSSGQLAIINLGPSAQVIRNFANVNDNVQIGAAPSVQGIPTLSEFGLILLALLMAGTTLWRGGIGIFNAKRKNQHP